MVCQYDHMKAPPFRQVERQPIYLQVAAQIREAILDGSMASGSQVPSERRLQQTFGVGRTTVREALRSVEAEGLVSRSSAGGWRTVAEPTLGPPLEGALIQMLRLKRVDLDDLADLRMVLETAAVERAANARPADALRRARGYLEAMRKPDIGVSEFQAADVGFHVALAGASQNEALHLIMLTLRDVLGQYMAAMQSKIADLPSRLPGATADHAAILAAVERGDAGVAVEHTRRHLANAHELLREMSGGSTSADQAWLR